MDMDTFGMGAAAGPPPKSPPATENSEPAELTKTDDKPSVTDEIREKGFSAYVKEIQIKPDATALELTWILAAWRPSFSAYLSTNHRGDHLGDVFQLAMADGLRIESVPFIEGRSLDIGTPGDLDRAATWLSPDA